MTVLPSRCASAHRENASSQGEAIRNGLPTWDPIPGAHHSVASEAHSRPSVSRWFSIT
jgi:hypothetical protein